MVMSRLMSLAMIGVVACNRAFGIENTVFEPDASQDEDGDGVSDVGDNCRVVANAGQSDDDLDGIGDACDNCPLVSNASQLDEGDGDAIGVACDPYPGVGGDCLILHDSFSDPSAFTQHWSAYHLVGLEPVVSPQVGNVSITPAGTLHPVAFVALGSDGAPIAGTFNVQVAATVALTTGLVAAVSNASTNRSGYGCAIDWFGGPELFAVSGTANPGVGSFLPIPISSLPIGTNALVRVNSQTPQTGTMCRVAYGVAIGFSFQGVSTDLPPVGGPGFRVSVDTADIRGVAVYSHQPGIACAPAILR